MPFRTPSAFRSLLSIWLLIGTAAVARAQFEMRGATFNRVYAPFVISTSGSTAKVVALSLTNAGAGYTSAPTVTISGGGGSGATATATVSGGSVTGFTVTNSGSGYTSPPTVSITGGGATTSAAAVAVFRTIPDGINPAVSTPQFAGIAANAAGSSALTSPAATTLIVRYGPDTNSTNTTLPKTFTINSTTITAAIVLRYPAQIYMSSSTTMSATPTGVAIVLQRSATGGSFAAGVPRYSLGDQIIKPSTQDGGIITADESYWRDKPVQIGESFAQSATQTVDTPIPLTIASISVTNGGSGYTSIPTVTLSGGDGTGATATATITQGIVTSITLTSAGTGYASLPTVTIAPPASGTTATAVAVAPTLPFYFSPHANRVFATQAGRVALTWVSRVPVASGSGADAVLKYRFKQETFAVSSATAKPTRTIYWTERSFNGPLVNIPTGNIETVNPVYNQNFPATVVQEYKGVGISQPAETSLPIGGGATLPVTGAQAPERRTLWFDKVAGVAQLRAYNLEGRIFVEYLGALQQGAIGQVHQFLGADIVDVVRVPDPVEATVYLGDQITPRDDDGALLPKDGRSEWIAAPVSLSSSSGQSLYASVARRDGVANYYAERENLTPDRLAIDWLEKSDAAIHFYPSPSSPNLGIYWPRVRNHYRQVWPDDIAKYSHNTVPAEGSTSSTGLKFTGSQLPQIVFQDDPEQSEARIDPATQRVVIKFNGADGLNRALLKFTAANEVWYIRLFSQTEIRPRTISVTNGGTGYTTAPSVSFTNGGTGAAATATVSGGKVTAVTFTNAGSNFTAATQVVFTGVGTGAAAVISQLGYLEGDAAPATVATVNVGERIVAPAGYEVAGYIAAGDNYLPSAYLDPFAVGIPSAALGAIIPVNAVPSANVLKIWWFKKVQPTSGSFEAFYTPAKIGTYTIVYPTTSPAIVLASNDGSGDLSSSEIAGTIYVQNDRTKPGFNPNEEHALLIGGRIYALRDDLNSTSSDRTTYTSEPFVLLQYTHPTDNRPAMRAFKVQRELDLPGTADDKVFNYGVTAGTILQPPMPLPLLPLPVNANGNVPNAEVNGITDLATFRSGTTAAPALYDKFTFKDRKGYTWVYRGPHGASPVNSVSISGTGTGFTSAPTVSLTGGGGSGATATATVSGGKIVGITITNRGSGYTSAPTVSFSGGGGSGASAIANIGPTLGMQFYYAMREGFYVPGVAIQPAVGTVMPYLRPIENGQPVGDPVSGTALTIVYRPLWPTTAAELRIAETLALPKFGLPSVMTATSANVLYQQSVATLGTAKPSVVLHDPFREKTFLLGTVNQLAIVPTSALTTAYQGKTYFQGIAPHLQDRFFYDPNRGTKGGLVLVGKFVDEAAGEDYVKLNVLSADDISSLKSAVTDSDTNKLKWDSAIDGLATQVETFVEDTYKPGTYKSNGAPVVVNGVGLAAISDSDTAVVDYALTATGYGSGWVSMIFGNGKAFTPEDEPVSISVFRVAPQLYTGELKVMLSSNPLDEKVTLRHSGDFAAKPEDYEFQWRYAPPQNGVAPPTYTYTMALTSSSDWKFVRNPAGSIPTASEYAAAPSAVTLPINYAIRTDSGRSMALPGLVAKRNTNLALTALPGSVIFSTEFADTNAGFVVYVNGSPALAYQAPTPFSNTPAATGLVSGGLGKQFELNPNYFQVGSNTIEIALFTSSPANSSTSIDFRFHVSSETDQVVAQGSPWQTPTGTLANLVMIGGSPTAPLGSPLLVMSDNYFTMRYRPRINKGNILAAGTSQTAVDWSRWMPAKLVEGWIKRVLAGINPFNQRVTDLYNNAINTDVSLLTQAGKRWEGDISLNLQNIDQFGLIEIYETVLNRGKTISIDAGYDYPAANDALLLAAGYLNDLYTILGNEAYADAANPTISIDDSASVTEVNTSRFSFEGQVKSVLEEELALLRGRDDFLAPGATVAPAYNRLYWNYTRGINSGETLYASNYNIREKSGSPTADGKVDASDAQRMFPQGHGDAYGHYLTALKGYTRLLQNSSFTWTPRSEAVTVIGQTLQVDYFDERKFATAAVNLARTAQQIIALTHRQSYKDDPALGWRHFSDGTTNPNTGITRYWGLDDWVARSAQGAYFNWILGNSMLPDKDTNTLHTGVQVIDRTTVPELLEVPVLAADFQVKIDAANARLNPLGLSPNAFAFDISPAELKAGRSHFDQIYTRSLQSVTNAKGAFDQAAKMTRLLRNQENQVSNETDSIVDQEGAFEAQLIEIYGKPYPSEIGPGKVYAQDYSGPDLYQWFIVDRPTEFGDTDKPQSVSLRIPTGIATFTGFALDDLVKYKTTESNFVTRTFTIQPDRFVQFSDKWAGGASMGQRPIVGTLQTALLDANQARIDLLAATTSLQHKAKALDRQVELAYVMIKAHTDSVAKEKENGDKIAELRAAQASLESYSESLDVLGDYLTAIGEPVKEFIPTVVGFSTDAFAPVRGSTWFALATGGHVIKEIAVVLNAAARGTEVEQEKLARSIEQAISDYGFTYEQAQVVYECELALRDVSTGIYEIVQLATALQRADEQVRNLLAAGESIQADRETFRKRAASKIQGYRTRDITFRTFRNEALEQYRSLFDLASRYTYLAAKAYDYETGLLGSTSGQAAINAIVSSRALGDLSGGIPQATVSTLGDAGLAGTMARLQSDWAVAKPRLGINNPDTNGTLFSLRRELLRILPDSTGDTAWQQALEQFIMSDVMADSDVARACRNLKKADGSAVPGIVIPFSSTIRSGYNFFGLPSAAGDHNFTPSTFATKIYSVGMVFRGYIGMDPYSAGTPNAGSPNTSSQTSLNATPYVYLIPVGTDYILAPPLGDTGVVRAFNVNDQALPLPFNLGASAFSSAQFFTASGTLTEAPWVLRKHQAFRPVSDPAFFYGTVPAEFTSSRLVGRSVWNSSWKIVIPAFTLLNSEIEGLNRFVASVKDIEIFLRTYSHGGN